MITKLYIIGNGFDLHHCLKTSYYNFAQYLQINYNEIYSILDGYVSFPTSDNDLWSKFEENLANLDIEGILSEHLDLVPNFTNDSFKYKDCYKYPDEMEQYRQALTDDLVLIFEEFIQRVLYSNNSLERKIFIDKEATFLSFNYTNTLERLYSVDKTKINYLHNSAFDGSESIILGHGIDPKTFEDTPLELPDHLESSVFPRWITQDNEYPYGEGREILMSYFIFTYKPTNEIIKRNSDFFKSLQSVKEIFVFGHSLSSIDLPYFKEIVNNIDNAVKWNVSFFGSDDIKRFTEVLCSFGIALDNIQFVELGDLQEKYRQLKIVFS